jgi:hypothetical protein
MELNREIVMAIPQFLDDQFNVRMYHPNNLVQFYHSGVVLHLAARSLFEKLNVVEVVV